MGKIKLKKSNTAVIVIFLIWCVALFIVLCNGLQDFWGNLHDRIVTLRAKDSLFCFLTPVIVSIICGIFPASWKAVIVFGRLRNPLPGCRAFTYFAQADPRIDVARLKESLGSLPEEPKDQNSKWYQLFKLVQDELTVQEAHRAFLLNRDLTGVSLLFFVFGTIALIPAGATIGNVFIYAAVTIVECVIFSIVARNHGNRFVCNVLAEYLNRK
jgi:hypothetical protein